MNDEKIRQILKENQKKQVYIRYRNAEGHDYIYGIVESIEEKETIVTLSREKEDVILDFGRLDIYAIEVKKDIKR